MRKLLFVSLDMCGGENLPPEFDLEEFCEVLQGKLTDVEVVPSADFPAAVNRDQMGIDQRVFHEALGEYCRQ